jgi:hypothetical protein
VSVFELEEFERSGDRLRVAGRWSDVRGMRFMRPSLTVGGRRILAVLDHKPWAPIDGERWVAEFPWDGNPDDIDLELAELAVAPSVAVCLAAPGVPVAPKEPVPDPRVAEDERRRRSQAEISFLREQIDLLTERLAETERERDEARSQIVPVSDPEPDPGLVAEVEAVRSERDAVRAERDGALRDLARARAELAAAEPPAAPRAAPPPPPSPPQAPPRPTAMAAPGVAVPPAHSLIQALELWVPRAALVVFAICVLLLLIGLLKVL